MASSFDAWEADNVGSDTHSDNDHLSSSNDDRNNDNDNRNCGGTRTPHERHATDRKALLLLSNEAADSRNKRSELQIALGGLGVQARPQRSAAVRVNTRPAFVAWELSLELCEGEGSGCAFCSLQNTKRRPAAWKERSVLRRKVILNR